jgi:hypothetical protein
MNILSYLALLLMFCLLAVDNFIEIIVVKELGVINLVARSHGNIVYGMMPLYRVVEANGYPR